MSKYIQNCNPTDKSNSFIVRQTYLHFTNVAHKFIMAIDVWIYCTAYNNLSYNQPNILQIPGTQINACLMCNCTNKVTSYPDFCFHQANKWVFLFKYYNI